MRPDAPQNLSYKAAQKRVKDIKGFYVHLIVYIVVNIAILLLTTRDEGLWEGLTDLSNFSTAFFWGIGLVGHGASVFGQALFFGKDWEERKIRELMEKNKRQNWE